MTDSTDPNDERFKRIEKKLNLLFTIAVGQSILLAFLVVGLVLSKFLASTLPTVLFLIVVVGFIVLFRNQIPGWFGQFSRYAFGKMISAQKTESSKDGFK